MEPDGLSFDKDTVQSERITDDADYQGVRVRFGGSPSENGYLESFNGKLRDELLSRKLFLHIDELKLAKRQGTKNHVFVQVFNKVALKVESLDSSR